MPNLYPGKKRDIVFRIEASGHIGIIGSLVAKAPGFSIEAYGGAQANWKVPSFSMASTSTVGIVGRADWKVPGFTLITETSLEIVASASWTVPGFSSRYGVIEGNVPSFTMTAELNEFFAFDPSLLNTYSVNLQNGGMTDYSNYPFEFMVRFQGKHYGFNEDGTYLLEGDNDNGTNIDSDFELPDLDFGLRQRKRLPYVYVGADTDKPLTVEATVDENTKISVHTKHSGRNRRAKLPRGLDGVHWSVRVSSQQGSAIKVEEMQLLPMILKRKV